MDTPLVQDLGTGSRQLRVAVVTETYPPEVNGVAMTIGRLVSGMLDLGHRVQLVRPRQNGADLPRELEGLDEVLAHGVPIPRYNHLKLGLPARRVLLQRWSVSRPDIVQVVTEGPLGWSAVAAARKLALPVVTEFHTNFHSYSRYYGVGWLRQPVQAWLRRFHNKGDRCLVPTDEMAAELRRCGVRDVAVVARGVDTALFGPHRRSAALRARWGVTDETRVVGMVGRLAPEKNLALAIDAFDAMAARSQLPHRLVLVGDGPSRAALASRRRDILFAGMQHGEALAEHYASADLFLFPSLTETFGNVTTEAMASGLPVLAFDYAAAAQSIRHGENGWLCPRDDADAYLRCARALADLSPEALLRCGQRARDSVQSLSWAAITDRLVSTFETVMAQHEARAGTRAAALAS